MSTLGETWRDPIESVLKTGFMNFKSLRYGVAGLAKESPGRIDILAVESFRKRRGSFRKFIKACQEEYDTVCVWVIFEPIVEAALVRYGFKPAVMEGDGTVPGMRWDRK